MGSIVSRHFRAIYYKPSNDYTDVEIPPGIRGRSSKRLWDGGSPSSSSFRGDSVSDDAICDK